MTLSTWRKNAKYLVTCVECRRKRSEFKHLACGFDVGVTTGCKVSVVHGKGCVGLDAKLGVFVLGVEEYDCRITDAPSVGQLEGEGHTAAAARLVAEDGDEGELAHTLDEVVGGGEATTVGEDDDGFLPAYGGGWIDVEGLFVGEVVVSLACLVAHIADEDLLVGEVGGELSCFFQIAATVVAHIEDESAAHFQRIQHVGDVAFADTVLERLVADVADVVVEDAVFESCCNLVVSATSEVVVDDVGAEVVGIVLVVTPVAPVVEGGAEVDVAVTQFAYHLAEHLKELLAVHVGVDFGGIAGMDLVPIDTDFGFLVVEEAVVFVHDAPERLEVVLRVILR